MDEIDKVWGGNEMINVGDKVTFLHFGTGSKKTTIYSWDGVVDHVVDGMSAVIKRKSKLYYVPLSFIRKADERDALTELVLGKKDDRVQDCAIVEDQVDAMAFGMRGIPAAALHVDVLKETKNEAQSH